MKQIKAQPYFNFAAKALLMSVVKINPNRMISIFNNIQRQYSILLLSQNALSKVTLWVFCQYLS